MSLIRSVAKLGAAAALCLSLTLPGAAQQSTHIRGTVISFIRDKLTVKTRTGTTEVLTMGATTPVFLVVKTDIGAVKEGKFVGITSVEKNGKRVAKEVHVFADSLRGLAEGHYPWDLDSTPNMMTNANIAKVQNVGPDRVLKLTYKGGEQTIEIPPSAVIVAFDKSSPDQLQAGRKVFAIGKKGEAALAAIVVGAPGITPPM
jgi:hypothetical protein